MALSLRNSHAEKLARELARKTGTTITHAIITALEEKLSRLEGVSVADATLSEIMDISRRCSELPLLDTRTEDEILGYGPRAV